ncbi:LuxR C-terminal-related transcriptional regulator [Paenibacillus chartarius]|uniref:LuxR C-terminal-related transcriptional regulator n=1 Tax=Paenibacillus chartarius TaxID=747481 RepID=A0ABV6DPC1_9BACL
MNREAEKRTVVLAFDQYEEAGGLDSWLRDELFPSLHAATRIVIAGKYALGGPWRLSPLWRKLILPLPLGELQYEEVHDYLRRQGIADEALRDRLWLESSGHPLSLSLLATLGEREAALAEPRRRTLAELLRYWLQEAPEDPLRSLVYAASVPRTFDQDLLSAVTSYKISAEQFERLLELSFVRKSSNGWTIHDLIRDAARDLLRTRMPDTFDAYRKRAVETLKNRIDAGLSAGASVTLHAAELLSVIGNPILRAHFRNSRSSENYWETVTASTLPEAERYTALRRAQPSAAKIVCVDTESDTWFRYELPPEVSIMRLYGWEPGELAAHAGDALRLLRSADGEVVGLAAIVPIHEGTMPYLQQSPLSSPYFRALPERELQACRSAPPSRPEGRFIFAVDVKDIKQTELRSDVVHLIFEHIAAGNLLITVLPDVPYFRDAHRSYGFKEVAGVPGLRYDGDTPAVFYRLDTRGGKLGAWLDDVADESRPRTESSPTPLSPAGQEPAQAIRLPDLTPRERDVAQLMAQGATNREIAGALYVSEAAVKKHIQSMLYKTGMKNRTQFVAALLDGRT